MRVLIAGGTGLVGQRVARLLLDRGDAVVVVGRSKERIESIFGSAVSAECYEGLTAEKLPGIDAIINLTGENVGSALRWNQETKRQILDSRVKMSSMLAQLASNMGPHTRLLNSSGISIYGSQDDGDETIKDEDSATPDQHEDFLTDVSIKWEAAATSNLAMDRLVLMRIGIVLARGEGALGKMELPFRLGAGGRLGSGRQNMSWISLSDIARAIAFILDKPQICGPVNFVAGFVPQMSFAEALAAALHRPCLLPAPAFALKIVLGRDMAQALVLSNHRIEPKRLKDAGFVFSDTDLATVLQNIYS